MVMVHWPSSGSTIENIFFVVSYSKVKIFQLTDSGSYGRTRSAHNNSGDTIKQWRGKSKSKSRSCK